MITDVFGSPARGRHLERGRQRPPRGGYPRNRGGARHRATDSFDLLVLHLGTPANMKNADDNHRAAAIRSLDAICRLAEPLGVRVAVEVIPNRLSDPASLVAMLDDELDVNQPGICLDFGHAHLLGDVADAVETVAEHIIATHVHDNADAHLVYRGSIDGIART
jgi:sugar phosphate isomerase/epimerase